ncbi:MAG: efflux RND transporter periplasmic adaptor subunit [Ignavibacteriaceae bacterium]|jgi:membrane fusion protein (multidrug efflux system)
MMKPSDKNISRIRIILISAFLFSLSSISCSDDEGSGQQFSMPPMPAEVVLVKMRKMTDTFEAVGTLEAIEEITIVSEIDAVIKSLPFKEGSFIKQGDLIAQLDDIQLAAEFARAEALYVQSQTNYNRIKILAEKNLSSNQELDDALAALKVAEANLEFAEARLSKTKIMVPFDGIIGTRKINVGDFIRIGQEITQLANLNNLRVLFSVPESFLGELKTNSSIVIYSTVFPGYEVEGKIIAIEPILNSETRNVNVVGYLKNPGQKFRSGMSANIVVALSERPNALIIPNQAVFASGDQSFVYVVQKDSSVTQVPVTLGLQLSDVVEVLNGLQNGMQVVQAGHQKLFPGAKILPVIMESDSASQKNN